MIMRLSKNIFLTCTIGFLILALSACDLSSTNENPNQATNTGLNNLLPHSQVNLAYGLGGDISQYNAVIMQQMAGTNREHQNVGRYNFSNTRAGDVWNSNLYGGSMNDLNLIINRADENEAWHHRGVAKILMANALGNVVALWNDVPFSEAFQGADNTRPVYDDAEELYDVVQTLLTDGKADLQRDVSPANVLGSADIVYGGDLDLWELAANALSARFHNHRSKIDPQGSAQNVLNALDQGTFSATAENMNLNFGTEDQQANPWYNHKISTFEDNTRLGEFFVDLLISIDDPRLPFYAAENSDGEFVGQEAGVSGSSGISNLGPYYNTPEAPVHFITYTEVKFLEAEANYRLGNFQEAAEAMNDAIISSLMKVTGDADSDYVAEQASEDAASIQNGGFERLMTHKYVALFLQPETFSDWRRSGIPELSPATDNVTGGVVPRRWPYAQGELNANSANVPSVSLTDRVWWDTQ